MKKQILIVDDDKIFNKILKDACEASGADYEVVTAFTGDEGLKMALEGHPDLIMLDLMLPGIEGIEFLRRLRADERGRDIPVVVETQLSDMEKMSEGMELGVRGYIIKATTSTDEIMAQINEILK